MTKEKYQTLPVATLRNLAKARGLHGVSSLRKEQLIQRMLQEDEKEKPVQESPAEPTPEKSSPEAKPQEKTVVTPAADQETRPGNTENRRSASPRRAAGSVPEGRRVNGSGYTGGQENTRYSNAQNSRSAGSQEGRYDTTGNRQNNRYSNGGGNRGNGQSDYRNGGTQNNSRYGSGQNENRYGSGQNENRYGSGQMENRYNRSQNDSRYGSSQNDAGYAGSGYNQNSRLAGGQDRMPGDSRFNGYERREEVYNPYPEYARENEYGGYAGERQRNDGYINNRETQDNSSKTLEEIRSEYRDLDSGNTVEGVLEIMPDGFGFLRTSNYRNGDLDAYVSPAQIRRFSMRMGDMVKGNTRVSMNDKSNALLYVTSINNMDPNLCPKRMNFDKMTPVFPDERIKLERVRQGAKAKQSIVRGNEEGESYIRGKDSDNESNAMRVVDLFAPIGKGQRGLIVSPPKAGKTTLLKDIARSIKENHKDIHLIILLIDERPEEVTDIRECLEGPNVEVVASTFDEKLTNHTKVSEMVLERAKRLVEQKQDVAILLDSITRLARAYNLTIPSSGRTLSGGLDPASLHDPKRFFGAARNMREGGSLTILATALIETGSKMDDVIYEEFKGTGNMELVLDRKLQEKRIFPAIDIQKSGTRKEDYLLSREELAVVNYLHRSLSSLKAEDEIDRILNTIDKTDDNKQFIKTFEDNFRRFPGVQMKK